MHNFNDMFSLRCRTALGTVAGAQQLAAQIGQRHAALDIVVHNAGAAWTESLSTTLRMTQGIKAGTVWVNCYGMLDPSIGFAGYKMSGYGVKGGPHQVESYLYPKVVYIKR